MESLWSEIRAVGPHHGPADWIEGNTGKVRRIAQRLEHRPMKQRKNVDDLRRSVIEREAKGMWAANGNLCDAKNQVADSELFKGSDLFERLACLGTFPVQEKLISVDSSPLDDKGLRASRKASLENLRRVCRDRRFMLTVDRVHVRRRMVSVVHVDRDSVEVRDTRHGIGDSAESGC